MQTKGPAVSIMAMSLDSHVVDHGLSPGPSGLNSRRARVRACPGSREENGEEGIAAWPSPLGGDFSLSLSVSLSFWQVCFRTQIRFACPSSIKPSHRHMV